MKKNMNRLFLFGITFLAFLIVSCSIGLGEALDLTGPDVEIISPTMRECVSENFSIVGNAYDNNDVKNLTVTISDGEGNIECEWKNENGEWTFRKNKGSDYVPYSDAVWQKYEDKKIDWQIKNINISTGRKILTVTAVDGEGNTSANSRKVITIIFDNAPPKVTITNPNIKYKKFDGEDGIKAVFSKLEDYKQLQIVNSVETGGFTISGVTTDDNPVKNVRLFVKTVDESGKASNFIEKNLVLEDSVGLAQGDIVQDTLRSWSVEITDDYLEQLGNGKNYLQISTESSDNAGNKDSGTEVHGYIVLWKDADRPWITINLGSSYKDKTEVYSGASCQGTAFDNVQVQKVMLTINARKETSWETIKGYDNIEVPIQFDAEDVVQTTNFQFNYPDEVGEYQIILKAIDIDGNESEQVEGYIDVKDMTFPSIEIEPITNPFGDAEGNFTIKATAFDDTCVKSIKYKICETVEEKANYSDKNSSVWENPTETTSNPQSTGTDNSNGFSRLKYNFEYSLNLFTNLDIGMDAKKLEQTTFIFLVEDKQGNRSITKFVLPADITPPEVTLEKVGEYDANLSVLSAFSDDFELSGIWGDDSFDVWKSMDAKKAPRLIVKLLGEELDSVKMKDDGTWTANVPLSSVQQYGSIVGAIDIEVSITDIGGSTITVQKGYQIDTNAPRLEYTSCNKPSGTYGAGEPITISLHFNREIKVTGTPSLTLSNGQSANYNSGSGTKELNFTFTTESGKDTSLLEITGGSLNNGKIEAVVDEKLKYENLSEEVTTLANKTMGKEIEILTSVPSYKSHSWDETEGKLTIVFNGFVKAQDGTITITQDESTLLAPAYLTKDEYNSMPDVQSYYEEGTLGADSSFNSDLTTKYILKYDTNTNDATLKSLYIATGAHKRSVNILSENVSSTQNASAKTTTFVLNFGALLCKGAKYTFDIPANLVKNDAKKGNAKKSNLEINSSGVETPVIRIYKPQQEITGASDNSAGTATHSLGTKFKIDCRTPGVSLNYKYDCLVATKCAVVADGGVTWGGVSGNINDRQEEWQLKFTYNNKEYYTNLTKTSEGGIHKKPTITPTKNSGYSKDSTVYTANSDVNIGDSVDYKNGLTYQITATASKSGSTVNAYEVAYRTTLVLAGYANGSNGIYEWPAINANYDYWPKNDNVAIFIRGSDNLEGANSTSGLPASWNINEKDKILMLAQDGNDFYFTTWNITVDKFYHQPLAGICDSHTNTAGTGNNQGPAYSIFQQDNIIFSLDKYPVGKGEYMEVSHGGRYDLSVPGKVMKHR